MAGAQRPAARPDRQSGPAGLFQVPRLLRGDAVRRPRHAVPDAEPDSAAGHQLLHVSADYLSGRGRTGQRAAIPAAALRLLCDVFPAADRRADRAPRSADSTVADRRQTRVSALSVRLGLSDVHHRAGQEIFHGGRFCTPCRRGLCRGGQRPGIRPRCVGRHAGFRLPDLF